MQINIVRYFLLTILLTISGYTSANTPEKTLASITYYDKFCERLTSSGKEKKEQLQGSIGGFLDIVNNQPLIKELEYWRNSYLIASNMGVLNKVCAEHKERLGGLHQAYFALSPEEVEKARQLLELAKEKEAIVRESNAQYIRQIANKVKDKWRYRGAKNGWSCDVYILQNGDGNVKSVNLTSCNTDKSAKAKSFRDSIERAIYKASPLPVSPDGSISNREILFRFKVN